MNILTKIRLINELNEKELKQHVPPENSWHQQYKDSAWVYAGNLAYNLSEGDILTVFRKMRGHYPDTYYINYILVFFGNDIFIFYVRGCLT